MKKPYILSIFSFEEKKFSEDSLKDVSNLVNDDSVNTKTLNYNEVQFATQSRPLIHPTKDEKRKFEETNIYGESQDLTYAKDTFCVSDNDEEPEFIKPKKPKKKRKKLRAVILDSSDSSVTSPDKPICLASQFEPEKPCPSCLINMPENSKICQICYFRPEGIIMK